MTQTLCDHEAHFRAAEPPSRAARLADLGPRLRSGPPPETSAPAALGPLPGRPRRRRWPSANLCLWVLQGGIGVFFFAAGYAKLVEPQALLGPSMIWPPLVDVRALRATGWVELLAACALVFPALFSARRHLVVPVASAGLCMIEIAALLWHASSGDVGPAVINACLLVPTAVVLVGRTRATPVAP